MQIKCNKYLQIKLHAISNSVRFVSMNERQYYEALGREIKTLRAAHNLTQDDLAFMLGISRVSLAMIEVGKQKMPLHIYGMFCKVFNSVFMVQSFDPVHTKAELMERIRQNALAKLEAKY